MFGGGDDEDELAVGCWRGIILTGRAAVADDGMVEAAAAGRSEKLGDA